MIFPELVRCSEREASLPEHVCDNKESDKSKLKIKQMQYELAVGLKKKCMNGTTFTSLNFPSKEHRLVTCCLG